MSEMPHPVMEMDTVLKLAVPIITAATAGISGGVGHLKRKAATFLESRKKRPKFGSLMSSLRPRLPRRRKRRTSYRRKRRTKYRKRKRSYYRRRY